MNFGGGNRRVWNEPGLRSKGRPAPDSSIARGVEVRDDPEGCEPAQPTGVDDHGVQSVRDLWVGRREDTRWQSARGKAMTPLMIVVGVLLLGLALAAPFPFGNSELYSKTRN